MGIDIENKNSVNVPLGVIRRESTPTYTLVSRLANSSHGRKRGMYLVTSSKQMLHPGGSNFISHNAASSLVLILRLQLIIHHSIRPSTSESRSVRLRNFRNPSLDVRSNAVWGTIMMSRVISPWMRVHATYFRHALQLQTNQGSFH